MEIYKGKPVAKLQKKKKKSLRPKKGKNLRSKLEILFFYLGVRGLCRRFVKEEGQNPF